MKKTSPTFVLPGAFLDRSWAPIRGIINNRPRPKSPYPLRAQQKKALQELVGKQFVLLNQPTGSGKSSSALVVNGQYLIDNPTHKLLIAIPKMVIAKSWVKIVQFKLPDGSTMDLAGQIGLDLCNGGFSDESKVEKALTFLRQPFPPRSLNPRDFRDRVLLCTHTLLALIYAKIRHSPDARATLSDTTILIDEAHRVLNHEGDEDEGVRNRLGEFVHFMVRRPPPLSKLWLVTATAFRGDGLSLLPAADLERFAIDRMTFYEYWRDILVDIKNYRYDFITYRPGKSHEVFCEILKRGKKKTFVFVGDVRHATRADNPIERLTASIKRAWGAKTKVLNLATEDDDRPRRVRMLVHGTDDGQPYVEGVNHRYEPDVVLSCRICDEGVDWENAQQAIDFAPLQSLNVVYQRFGRLTRNAPGKPHLEYYTLLPVPGGKEDHETMRQMFNENLVCLMGAMMLEDMGQPRRFGQKLGDRTNWLAKAFPDPTKEAKARAEAWTELMKAYADAKENATEITKEQALDITRGVLEEAGVKQHLTETTQALFNACRYLMWKGRQAKKGLPRVVRSVRAADVVKAGLAPVKMMKELEGGWWYSSAVCRLDTLSEFRVLFQKVIIWLPFEQAREYVRKLRLSGRIDFSIARRAGKIPLGIPSNPQKHYQDWKGWSDFLGTITVRYPVKISVAQQYVRDNHITTVAQWKAIPITERVFKGLPRSPMQAYKCTWRKFVGKRQRTLSCSLHDFIDYIQKTGIRTSTEFAQTKLPEGIPTRPDCIVPNWPGWPAIWRMAYDTEP